MQPKEPGEFVNTWSVDGFVSEGSQPAELGWGSHEKNWPRDGKQHDFGRGSAIYLMQPGAGTRVRTWTPLAGQFHGFLITHGESISISDYLTLRKGDQVQYRPTVHYAYHPCDARVLSVHELAGKQLAHAGSQADHDGRDHEGHRRARRAARRAQEECATGTARSCRSQEARQLAPHNNATSLQVTVAVLGGHGLGDREPERRRDRARRHGFRARARDLPSLISATSSASTASGTRSSIAAGCSPRISTRPTRGSSRTCA